MLPAPSPTFGPTLVATASATAIATAIATALELLAAFAVVHRLVRHAMRERGLPTWSPGDTLLTSPLFFVGAALFLGGTNGGILALADSTSAAVPWGVAASVGLVVGAFGARAFGKLY